MASGTTLPTSTWSPPACELQAAHVCVPPLHRSSLVAATAAVQATVDQMPTPPVVLGHSYGGSVITGLTGAAHLVYLAAFVPDHGESAAGLGGPDPVVNAVVRRSPDGFSDVDPDLATQALYADCSPEHAAWACALLRPQAPGHGRGVPQRIAWRTTASTYVICQQDRGSTPRRSDGWPDGAQRSGSGPRATPRSSADPTSSWTC